MFIPANLLEDKVRKNKPNGNRDRDQDRRANRSQLETGTFHVPELVGVNHAIISV